MVPFCLGRLFVLRPVGGGGEGGPGFGGGAEVGVAVGGLLDVEVVPAGGVGVVLPGLHAGEEGARGLRGAAGGAVDHGHELGAGDGLIGAEGAVGVAVDPAEICGQGDGVRGPVARGDVREVDRGGLLLGELRQHGGELGAGDGVIGAEIAGAAVGDDAGVVEGGDVGVIPLGGIDVAEAGGSGIVQAAGVGVHEAEEDSRDLGPGDAARGLDRPVGIALHVGEVVTRVELRRRLFQVQDGEQVVRDGVLIDGHRGLWEFLLLAIVACAVHGEQICVFVGVERFVGVIALACRVFLAVTVEVVHAVGTGCALGVRQLESVFQLHRVRLRDRFVDVPREHFILCVIRHDKAGLPRIIAKVIGIAAPRAVQLLAVDGQRIDADKLEVAADGVFDFGACRNELDEVGLDGAEDFIFLGNSISSRIFVFFPIHTVELYIFILCHIVLKAFCYTKQAYPGRIIRERDKDKVHPLACIFN
mgnify:CR=1 FL=1